jgi:4-hydroxy-3-polyprenylbenzoate decarboxylase
MRIVVGITGASGVVYGVRLLETLRELEGVETHLVATRSAELTLKLETDVGIDHVRALADVVHGVDDIGATISSGSFRTDGMIVAPCSIKTLSGIVHSYSDNLLLRAADVTLKERRRLVLVVRETPLHLGQLRLLAGAAELGATIFPPTPAFYNRPASLDDMIDQTVGRVLDQVGLDSERFPRWEGTRARARTIRREED